MYSHIDCWKNKSFWASIGEPWDFVSSAGENRLNGIIVDALCINGSTCLLCNVSPFIFDGRTIDSVVVVNRYSKTQEFNISNACSKNGIVVNFVFSKDSASLNLKDFFDKKNDTNTSFLIGTLYIDSQLSIKTE